MYNSKDIALYFKALLDNSPESIILISPEHKVLVFNKGVANFFKGNRNIELSAGMDYRLMVLPDFLERYDHFFNSALKGEINEDVTETIFNGTTFWFEHSFKPVYQDSGEILGITISAKNITEHQKAELALKESEIKFRGIVDATPLAIIIVDEEMNINTINPEVTRLFGYMTEELMGRNIKMLIPDRFHEGHKHSQKEYLQHNTPMKMSFNRYLPAKTKAGSELMVEIGLNSFLIQGKRFVLAMIQDVSGRVESEQQITRQLAALKQIAWQQSHEFRRPIANIQGIVNMLKMPEMLTGEQMKEMHEYLLKEANDIDEVLRKITLIANGENMPD